MTGATRGRFRRWWRARRGPASAGAAVSPSTVGAAAGVSASGVLSEAELAERARAEILVLGAAVQIVLEEEQRLKAQLDRR